MEAAQEPLGSFASLVRVAVRSDDSARLLAEAGLLDERPFALVGPHGEPLGYVPEGSEGRRALAVARAAARNRLVGAAGWHIVPIRRASSSLGFLAIGARRGGAAGVPGLVDLLPELVAEQLHRVALLRAQRDAFVRRFVSDPRFGAREARREADELGLELAGAYWPAILTWHGTPPPGPLLERLARHALGSTEGGLAALLQRRVVLLRPSRDDDAAAEREEAFACLAQVVAHAGTLAPSFPPQAIVGEQAVPVAGVSAAIAELQALCRLGPRTEDGRPVVPTRAFALERLFREHLDAAAAHRFVAEQLERLAAWDREHRTDLLAVLEAALDFPRHDQAASRCYMHRNTFRHRLQQAGELLGTPLDDPDERLAVHVALKLRRIAASADGEARLRSSA